MANDWALLKLDEPLDVEPIELGTDPEEFDTLGTAGWGDTGEEFPTVAQWVEVPFVDDDDCAAAYPTRSTRPPCCAPVTSRTAGSTPARATRAARSWPPARTARSSSASSPGATAAPWPASPGVYSEIADFNDAIDEVIAGLELATPEVTRRAASQSN